MALNLTAGWSWDAQQLKCDLDNRMRKYQPVASTESNRALKAVT